MLHQLTQVFSLPFQLQQGRIKLQGGQMPCDNGGASALPQVEPFVRHLKCICLTFHNLFVVTYNFQT